MGTAGIEIADAGAGPRGRDRRLPLAWVGTVPFFAYVGVFLLLPTGIVVWGAIFHDGRLRPRQPEDLRGRGGPRVLLAFDRAERPLRDRSAPLLGAVLAYAIATGQPERVRPQGVDRRLGRAGPVRRRHARVRVHRGDRPHQRLPVPRAVVLRLPLGIGLIYIYFQIPLMVLIFLPAIDGHQAAMAGGHREPRRLDVGLLAPRRRAAAVPGVPGLHAPAVRERAFRLRHDPGLGEPDPVRRAAEDQPVAVERGRARLDERGPGARPRDGRRWWR